MQAMVSSIYRVIKFPHKEKIVTIVQLSQKSNVIVTQHSFGQQFQKSLVEYQCWLISIPHGNIQPNDI